MERKLLITFFAAASLHINIGGPHLILLQNSPPEKRWLPTGSSWRSLEEGDPQVVVLLMDDLRCRRRRRHFVASYSLRLQRVQVTRVRVRNFG